MSKPKILLAILLMLCTSTGGLLGWATTRIESPSQRAAKTAAPEKTVLTANVKSEPLSNDLVTTGTVISGQAADVPVSTGTEATSIVTALPLRIGDPVRNGSLLGEISGRPLIALKGSIPSYRDLHPGDQGKDVAQLQVALKAMGIKITDASGILGSSTQSAITSLYTRLGYKPKYAIPDPAASTASPDATTTTSTSPTTIGVVGTETATSVATAVPQLVIPHGEFTYFSQLPASVAALNLSIGQTAAGSLMTIAYGAPVVKANLSDSDIKSTKVGQSVTLHFDDGTEVSGQVSSIANSAQSNTSTTTAAPTASEEQAFVLISSTNVDLTNYLNQSAQVSIVLSKTAGNVLVVPSSAIYIHNDGSSFVISDDPSGRREIPVSQGLDEDGMVQVLASQNDLTEGERVVLGTSSVSG